MAKAARQKTILEIVETQPLPSQDLLRKRLSSHGFRVTQATLSRDIHELGLVKTAEGYTLPQMEVAGDPALPPAARLVREFVTEVREAQNLLVIKTATGSAQPVAAALDAEAWHESVGTIAGDDTILIVSADKKSASALASRIRELMA